MSYLQAYIRNSLTFSYPLTYTNTTQHNPFPRAIRSQTVFVGRISLNLNDVANRKHLHACCLVRMLIFFLPKGGNGPLPALVQGHVPCR